MKIRIWWRYPHYVLNIKRILKKYSTFLFAYIENFLNMPFFSAFSRRLAVFIAKLKQLFLHACNKLPLLLFLSGCALTLESQGLLTSLDAAMVTMISTLDHDTEPERSSKEISDDVIAVIASQKMFSEAFGRTLPINRDVLADFVAAVASKKPKVIAIDVDVSRLSTNECDNSLRDSGRLHKNIVEAVQNGISVAAVKYPNPYSTDSDKCLEKLKADTDRASASWESMHKGKRPPSFLLANPDIDLDEQPGVVVRFENPLTIQDKAGGKQIVPNLGVAASLLGDIVIQDLEKKLWCAVKGTIPCNEPDSSPSGHSSAYYLINYFHPPRQIYIDEFNHLSDHSASIEGRVVFIGIDSFANTDRYLTPLGYQNGALIHAAIGVSMKKPIKEVHGLAVVLDVIAGIIFLMLFESTKKGYPRLSRAPTIHAASILIGPISAIAISFILCRELIISLIGNHLWVNPLPIFLGLCVHLFLEYSQETEHKNSPSIHRRALEKISHFREICLRLFLHRKRESCEGGALKIVDDAAWCSFNFIYILMICHATREVALIFWS